MRFKYILSAALLFYLATNTGFSQSDVTRQKVDALLGVPDVAVSPEQWRSLNAAAGAILENIASDSNALPTRRARALEGIVALRTQRANELLVRFAHSEDEPLVLRMSAVRGLGHSLSSSSLITELQPILQTARDPQLRGVAAEVLARDLSACGEVQKQANRETSAWRERFFNNGCVAGGAAPDTSASPKILSPDPTYAEPRVATRGAGPGVATSAGETQVVDLGTIDVFTDHLSAPLTVTVPANAASIDFEGVAVSDPTGRLVVYRIESPAGLLYDFGNASTSLAKIQPPLGPGSFSVLLPNSPTLPFQPGTWTIKLLGSKQTTSAVKAIIKTAPANPPATINMNLFFVGVANLNASNAPTDQNFQSIIDDVRQTYAQLNITIGNLNYIDITGADATRYRDLQESDLGALVKLSNNAGAQQNAVNLFFVHSIVGGSLEGFIILGESAGLPGNPFPGTTGSGVAVTMADFPAGLTDISATWAHEMGHWFGLFHSSESSGMSFDPLPDTPECHVDRDANGNGILEPSECVGFGADNVMFWTSVSSIPHGVFTANQQYVLLRNPVVMTTTAPTPTPTPTPSPTPTPTPTPTPAPIQLMLDTSGPAVDQVAAIDSLLFLRDPFPVVNAADLLNLGNDRNSRVIIFVTDLQLAQGETAAVVVVNLVDSNSQVYDINAEDVRLVPNLTFTQVIFRLPTNLATGTCTVRVRAHGQTTNAGTIRIRI